MNSSKNYYDAIAEKYQTISHSRKNYLSSIDNIIIEKICHTERYLDVGAGDGVRSVKLAKRLNCKNLVLLDNSDILECYNDIFPENTEKVITSVTDYKTDYKFSLITCLWNVIGHVGDATTRKNTFIKFKELLAEDGVLILDVNNRYNIAHYGYINVMENLKKDMLNDINTGWFDLFVGENSTKVYIHAPLEIDTLCASIGLKIEKTLYVDYNTGEEKETFFEGQLLYIIKHNS